MTTYMNTSKSYIIKLSVPIFFSNIAIPFAGLVDTGLMGHLNNEKFLAAIGIAASVITMVFWSFGFLRMGTVGLVSQALGKEDYNEVILVYVRNLILASLSLIFVIFLLKIFPSELALCDTTIVSAFLLFSINFESLYKENFSK